MQQPTHVARPHYVHAVQWSESSNHPHVHDTGHYDDTVGHNIFVLGESGDEVYPGDWIVTYCDGSRVVMTESEFDHWFIRAS